MKTKWSDVIAAATNRRAAGADTDQNILSGAPQQDSKVKVGRLWNIVNDDAISGLVASMTGKTEATVAFGIIFGADIYHLMLVNKGGQEAFREQFSAALQNVCQHYAATNVGITMVKNPDTGLHAEMAIIRALLKQFPDTTKQNLGRNVAIVCVGKPVCMDCAGWMNSHAIGHCSFPPETPPTIRFNCGPVSTMGGGIWKSPTTNSTYGGGNDLQTYHDGKRPPRTLNPYSI
jgi:hypothetical protein